MADRPNRLGQQLGNYRLIALMGEGGFAEVYLDEHIHQGAKPAIKVLHPQLTNNDVKAFCNKTYTIIHLVHPYIAHVSDFGVEGRISFLIMDYPTHGHRASSNTNGEFICKRK